MALLGKVLPTTIASDPLLADQEEALGPELLSTV
jgi:hypothetical protein